MVTVKFGVVAMVPTNQDLYVVGSCIELGQWHHDKAVKMLRCQPADTAESHWYVTLEIHTTKKLEYRYFIGKTMYDQTCGTDEQEGVLTVQCWEGGPTPRQVYLADQKILRLNDRFGKIGNRTVKYPGWLTKQKEVRLMFQNNAYVTLGRKAKPIPSYRIQCLPLHANQDNFESVEPEKGVCGVNEEMLYFDLADGKTEYTKQPKSGVLVKPDSIITFRMQTLTDSNLPIRINIYREIPDSDDDLPLVGHSIILPDNLSTSSTGVLRLPVHGTNMMCGQLTLEYLVITPLPSYTCTMASSCSLEWDNSHRMLYIGHRGMGMSRTKHVAPSYKENTIYSFNEAASHGADFVEFDVQLTKDHVPVIFHDFNCRLSCTSFSGAPESWHDVAVVTLTYDQLRKLQIGFSTESKNDAILYPSTKSKNAEGDHLFPTVLEAFEGVSPELGFNIEVKYPMKLESGVLEDGLQTFMDMNEYINSLLENLLTHVGERNVIFTSFNPDVCTMLRMKQNRFPVSLLTQGKTERYLLYKDPRTHDIHKVLYLAKAEHFLGVNPISEYIIKDPTLIESAHNLDLVLMSWGSENQDQQVQRFLKEHRVHAMIFDNIDEVIEAEKCEKKLNNNF